MEYRINIRKLLVTGNCKPKRRLAKSKKGMMPWDYSNLMQFDENRKIVTAKHVESGVLRMDGWNAVEDHIIIIRKL